MKRYEEKTTEMARTMEGEGRDSLFPDQIQVCYVELDSLISWSVSTVMVSPGFVPDLYPEH